MWAGACTGLMEERPHHSGTEISLAEKSGPLEYSGVRFGVGKLDSEGAMVLLSGDFVFMPVDKRGKWHQPAPLFPEMRLCERCFSGTCSKKTDWSLDCVQQAFFR